MTLIRSITRKLRRGWLLLIPALTPAFQGFADAATREHIQIYPGAGWQYADTGNRDTFAPPTGGWSSTELQWPNLYWQRMTLPIPADWSSRRVVVRIGACAYGVTLYVNGQHAGRHQAPVTPVEVDITPYLNWGGSDVLMLGLEDWSTFLSPAVSLANNGLQLSHVPNPSVQGPMGYAYWLFQRKLWTQDISIQAVPRVRIEEVFVKPSVRENRLDVEMTLRNDDSVPRSILLDSFVTPWGGDTVEKEFDPAPVVIPAGTNLTTTLSVSWSNPTLWSPDQPHLYQLDSSLTEGETVLDSVSTRFGFREFWVEASPDGTRRWFVLNGNRQNIRGEGMWHPYLGTNYVNTFMDWLKDNHFNMLRIENGGLPQYYAMADEKGLLIQSELPFNFNQKYEYNATFWERTASILEAQIRAYRNHPSVVIWGIENEVMLTSPGQAIGADLMALQTLARTLDPTRAVMHEGDGDLRTIQTAGSPSQNVQVVNIHDYEVETGRAGGVMSIMDFPNAGHAFGRATTASELPGYAYGTALPDKSKPWFIGEFGPGAVFSHPHGLSFLNGDQAYVDLFGLARGLNGALGLYYGFQIDGFRSLDYIGGIAPWAAYFGDPRIETGPVIREFFKPVTVRVKEWNRNFFAGDPVSRTLITHNDDVTDTSNFRIDWSLEEEGQTLLSGSLSFTAEPGFSTQRTLTFTAPSASKRRDVELVLALTRNGISSETVSRPLSIFPARQNLTVPTGLQVLLYEPASNTAADGLHAAGIAHTRLSTLDLTGRPAGLLILGFASYNSSTPADTLSALRTWIQSGGTVLVNGDQYYHPPWLSFYGDANYGVQNFWIRASIGFIRAPHHPLLSGFQPDDFKWWAPDQLIANDNGNWTKPSSGLFTVLVDTGGRNLGLGDSPLAEYPDGSGSTLVNKLLLFDRINQEPVARQLLQNLLNYADSVTRQPPPKTIGVLSGNSSLTTNVLARMKVPYQSLDGQLAGHTAASLGAAFSAVLVDNNATAWTEVNAHGAKLQNYVRDGGTVILRRLTTDRAASANALMGVALTVQPTQLRHPQLEKKTTDPLLDGVSHDDTFWVVPSGYRTQVWVSNIIQNVIQIDENAGVRGLLIEPGRTGMLQPDSGQSYNLGSADRDPGVDVADPGFGLVRIQPPEARGSYVVDQLLWDQSMGTAYNRKAQRVLSALLVQTRQTHTPALPMQTIELPQISALIHLLLPDGTTETIGLKGSGVLAVFVGPNGETNETDSEGLDRAKAGFLSLDLQGQASTGPIRIRHHSRRPGDGWMRERSNPVPGILDIPPYAPDGTADSAFELHLHIEIGGETFETEVPVGFAARISDLQIGTGEVYLAQIGPIALVSSSGASGPDLQWEVWIPRRSDALPSLSLSQSGWNPKELRWPAPDAWVLQATDDLTEGWQTVPGPYRTENNFYHVEFNAPGPWQFYRLARPD